jgi:predicted AAA+ superfamily ATPase
MSWLNKLRSFKNTDLIKVITGIRRCGKSSIMELYMDELKQSGIKSQNAVFGDSNASLMAIKDSYQKIILSMDKTFIPDYNGIKHKYILDFLME